MLLESESSLYSESLESSRSLVLDSCITWIASVRAKCVCGLREGLEINDGNGGSREEMD